MASVFFAGPLPPPVHGFSVINSKMLTALRSTGVNVNTFDLSPQFLFSPLFRWLKFIISVIEKGRFGKDCLYIPLSGGIRQLVDIAFIIPAKLMHWEIFVHHHTFFYLMNSNRLSRMALSLTRNSLHIVLCSEMGRLLTDVYSIPAENIRILSNAAFLKINEVAIERSSNLLNDNLVNEVKLGFLSNITVDKGIFSFFDSLSMAKAMLLPYRAVVAGPLDKSVQVAFNRAMELASNTTYLGAVYGDAKVKFFNDIDLLLFPSNAAEAEPVTLWEALAHGVPVVARQRGCIRGMLSEKVGRVVCDKDDFETAVVEEIAAMQRNPGLLAERRLAARKAFETAHRESSVALASLLLEMTKDTKRGLNS